MKILKMLGIVVAFVILLAFAGGLYINIALPDTGATTVVKIEASPVRLERGRYLANHVAACMDCHGTRNWALFSGPPISGSLGKGG